MSKGEKQKNNSINNKGGDCWTKIVINVNMAIFEEPRGAIYIEPSVYAKEEEQMEMRGAHRAIGGATGARGTQEEQMEMRGAHRAIGGATGAN